MDIVLKDGSVISEEQVREWAESAEKGDFPGAAGQWVVRPAHRPAVFAEELDTVSFKLPHSLRLQLDKRVKDSGRTRSDFVREAITKELLATA